MKIRWREHELIFVTILVVRQIVLILVRLYTPGNVQLDIDFAERFRENDYSFIFWRNVLFPQIGTIILVYGVYLSINRVIVPLIKKISFHDVERIISFNIIKVVLATGITGYILALGINVISYYGRPFLFNYGGYQLLAICGYNDQPLSDLFFGFGSAIGIVTLFTALTGFRELLIWLLEKPGPRRDYRVLIANNATPLVFIFFLVLVFMNPLHRDFLLYVACIAPIFLLYIYLTFWLFPVKGETSFLYAPVFIRLMASTGICALPSVILIGRFPLFFFILYWAFLLFIVTPLCWLLYQQRKNSILRLRGMETALARSDADLQFLRSQINPHFLFNALNTLYGTALKENAEHTADGIQKLGDMMRFMLHDNNLDYISMTKETEYLKNYIALQKLRIQSSPGILITDNIDEADCDRNIAPMLLIPFVENAFKHGISVKEKSWIRIRLDCTGKDIHFEVSNSRHKRADQNEKQEKSGIGLKNVQERLKLLYPGRYELVIRETTEEFLIRLLIKDKEPELS